MIKKLLIRLLLINMSINLEFDIFKIYKFIEHKFSKIKEKIICSNYKNKRVKVLKNKKYSKTPDKNIGDKYKFCFSIKHINGTDLYFNENSYTVYRLNGDIFFNDEDYKYINLQCSYNITSMMVKKKKNCDEKK